MSQISDWRLATTHYHGPYSVQALDQLYYIPEDCVEEDLIPMFPSPVCLSGIHPELGHVYSLTYFTPHILRDIWDDWTAKGVQYIELVWAHNQYPVFGNFR